MINNDNMINNTTLGCDMNPLFEYILDNHNIPKVIDLKKGRVGINSFYCIQCFGSYYNMLNTVIEQHYEELNFNNICDKWIKNRDNILMGVESLIKSIKRIPKQEEYIKYASENKFNQRYNWYFDDFNCIIHELDKEYKTIRTKYNEKEVITDIKLLAQILGRTPSCKEYYEYAKENNKNSNLRYYKEWNYFIKEAGLKINKGKITEEELIECFYKSMNELNRVPLLNELKRASGISFQYHAKKLFNGYNSFLKLRGLESNHRDAYTEKELQEILREYVKKERLTRDGFYQETGIYYTVYSKRYGGWHKAIKKLTGINAFKSKQFAYPYKSNHGEIRPSSIEGRVDDLIGEMELVHEHDYHYSKIFDTDRKFNMDFFVEGKYIIEVAGMISEKEFYDGVNKLKSKYLLSLKEKIELVNKHNNGIYKLIIIFKNEINKEIIKSKLSLISDGLKDYRAGKQGMVIYNKLNKFPDN